MKGWRTGSLVIGGCRHAKSGSHSSPVTAPTHRLALNCRVWYWSLTASPGSSLSKVNCPGFVQLNDLTDNTPNTLPRFANHLSICANNLSRLESFKVLIVAACSIAGAYPCPPWPIPGGDCFQRYSNLTSMRYACSLILKQTRLAESLPSSESSSLSSQKTQETVLI